MKVMTVLGTRPEIIRLSVIMKKLDRACDHVTVWTGQNYDDKLSKIFFEEFDTRKFDYVFSDNSKNISFHYSLAMMISNIGGAIKESKPDKVLILGDTNSSLAGTIVAERMGVPVYHMEAGNRCYDMKVPEEKNRIMIDAISSFNLPYVENSRENLIANGFPKNRIFKCGNPINEVINNTELRGNWMEDLFMKLGIHKNKYILVTTHRAENVDDPQRLTNIVLALEEIKKISGKEIIFSVHPRTKDRLKTYSKVLLDKLIICEPFNFKEFILLEMDADCIITDSGTVQEEAAIIGKPCVIIRDSTERPETIEAGLHVVSGLDKEKIVECFKLVTNQKLECRIPDGYCDSNVSDKVINFLLGKQL